MILFSTSFLLMTKNFFPSAALSKHGLGRKPNVHDSIRMRILKIQPLWSENIYRLTTLLSYSLQVKEKMNSVMHKLNLVRSDGRAQSAQKTLEFDKHVNTLEDVDNEIRALQDKVIGVRRKLTYYEWL